jgi:hypothetical protein
MADKGYGNPYPQGGYPPQQPYGYPPQGKKYALLDAPYVVEWVSWELLGNRRELLCVCVCFGFIY